MFQLQFNMITCTWICTWFRWVECVCVSCPQNACLSRIPFNILYGILSGILSDSSSDILIYILPGIFWHSIWHSIWHSTWHIFLSFYLTQFLICYLDLFGIFLKFYHYIAFLLAFVACHFSWTLLNDRLEDPGATVPQHVTSCKNNPAFNDPYFASRHLQCRNTSRQTHQVNRMYRIFGYKLIKRQDQGQWSGVWLETIFCWNQFESNSMTLRPRMGDFAVSLICKQVLTFFWAFYLT